MYYSGLNCFGRKLEDVHKATFLINFEKAFPGFLRSWEKLKERICKGNHFVRKDDYALAVYCGLYVHYVSELGFKDRFEEFENYFYLLIAIQTKIQAAHLSFDEMIIIDSVEEECSEGIESELLELISNMNETIRLSWGETKGRLDNLTIQNNIDKLAILNEKVLEEEQKFLKTIDVLVAQKGDFSLKDVLNQLRFAFICYEEALIDMKEMHKKLSASERLIVNSPEKCCEFAKEIFLEESKKVGGYAVAIFKNGTTVTGLEYKEDIEAIKEQAKRDLIEVCEAGDAIETFVEKEFDNEWLMMLARIGYGVANYYMEQKDCYFDTDEEIARGNRTRDGKELKIKYILYDGEIIFDLEKEEKEQIEMDKIYIKGLRNIAKQLDEIGFPEGKDVAMYIMEDNKTKLELSDDEMEAAKYILELIGTNGDARVHPGQIACGIDSNREEIKKVYDFLVKIGYSKEQLDKFYSKNQSAFCYKCIDLEKQFDYLKNIGLSQEQALDVFLDTIYLGYDETKQRCETVLKYFDIQMVYTLGNRYLFYGYYTDPVDGIEYMVERLGVEKAKKLFLEQDMILYLWKEKYQRNDWTHGPQHREALELIEKYEN